MFARAIPSGGLEFIREIVSHAVRLYGYMMHEAQLTYALDLERAASSYDEFYNNQNDMKTVNTDTGKPVWIARLMRNMAEDDLRRYLYRIA